MIIEGNIQVLTENHGVERYYSHRAYFGRYNNVRGNMVSVVSFRKPDVDTSHIKTSRLAFKTVHTYYAKEGAMAKIMILGDKGRSVILVQLLRNNTITIDVPGVPHTVILLGSDSTLYSYGYAENFTLSFDEVSVD